MRSTKGGVYVTLRVGDVVIISNTKMLRKKIRGMRGRILEIDNNIIPSVRIKVIEGEQKGLIFWVSPSGWFEVVKERVVFT